jgi:hypothetical protein
MKLNTEKVNTLLECRINDEMVAMCENGDGFMKMMVLYRHGNPVWAHKDCVAVEPARSAEKPKKNSKKGLTKRK